MTHEELAALAGVLAPLMRDMVGAAMAPVVARQAEFEALFATMRGDVHEVARVAVADAMQAVPRGEAGPVGPAGPAGRDGVDGAPGRDGLPGADGRSMTVNEVLPMISDAVAAYMADHPVPAGRDGVDGKDGAPGERGAPGPQGPAGMDGVPGRDGVDGRDGAPGERGMPGPQGLQGLAGADGVPGRDGADGKDGAVGERGAPGPHGPAGVDGAAGRDGLDGKDGAPGKLPVARAWADGVTYEGEVRTHGGALWQAVRDTGHEPGHADWICLAARGADGVDATQIDVVGTWDVARAGDYRRLNVVALNGATFIARRDAPGECPGEGWQLMSIQGRRGPTGERGERGATGPKGDPGPGPLALSVDGQGLVTLVLGDGSALTCDLYDVLSKR